MSEMTFVGGLRLLFRRPRSVDVVVVSTLDDAIPCLCCFEKETFNDYQSGGLASLAI